MCRNSRRSWSARFSGFCLLALLALLLLGSPEVVAEPIGTATATIEYTFARSITFTAQIESDTPIESAVLFYGIVGEPVVRRIYPDLQPGQTVTLRHTEDLEAGQFAPGTELRAWWRLALGNGDQVSLAEERILYLDQAIDWQEMRGERVTLFWHGRNQAQAEGLLDAAEEVIDKLALEMGVPSPKAVRVWVYSNERDLARATSPRSEAYDARITTLGMAMDGGTLLLLGSHRNVHQTLAHELCHVVVGLATENPYIEIPRWLDEGLAMNAEGELPRDNRRALEDAIARDDLISLRSLTSYTGNPALVNLFYAQSHSVVAFILEEFGQDAMRELLAVFAEGQRQDDALERVFGFGLDELEDRWRASVGLGPVALADPGAGLALAQLSPATALTPSRPGAVPADAASWAWAR